MNEIHESWSRIRAHLATAAGFLNATADLAAYSDYLEHNELQLAADELHDAADERGDLPKAFWQALLSAFESMKLDEDVRRCRVRIAKLE